MEDGMDKPKPCPFCGAELYYDHLFRGRGVWRHPFDGCIMGGEGFSDGRLLTWNKRAPWTVTKPDLFRLGVSNALAAFKNCDANFVDTEIRIVEALGGKVEG